MKRIIYKASIIVPLAMIFYSFIEPFAFCVPEIGLYMETWSSRILIVMVTVVWLCCSPFRCGTCNGTITELLFNLVPVEFVLTHTATFFKQSQTTFHKENFGKTGHGTYVVQ